MDPGTPDEIFEYWDAAIKRIGAAKDKYGDLILPGNFKG